MINIIHLAYHSLVATFHIVGTRFLRTAHHIGVFVLFFIEMLRIVGRSGVIIKRLCEQIERIGIESLNIVVLTGTFSGMVFALQSYIGFSRIGGEQLIGSVVALGMARELGPVLTGLIVTGRVSSSIAAELGTMRITEQIDALTTLRINAFSYLIAPRILAAVIVLPCLTLFATFCGILGGYMIVTHILHLNAEQYFLSATQLTELGDFIEGLIKAACFGLILSWVGCYKGYYAHGGARGVGSATTQAVVLSSILILITNYFLTKLLDHL